MNNKKRHKYIVWQRIRMRAAEKHARKKNVNKERIRRKLSKEARYSLNHKINSNSKYLITKRTKKQQLQIKKVNALQRLPKYLRYLIQEPNSPFFREKLKKVHLSCNGQISIPQNFSIIDNHNESYETLQKIIYALLIEDLQELILNYDSCTNIELGTQLFFDIILKDYTKFRRICEKHLQIQFPKIKHTNIKNTDIKKLFWSVGTPAILDNKDIHFNDIEKCPLRFYDKSKDDKDYSVDQKELDVTELTDYVIESLKRINKELTRQQKENLCTIIGEILINAEEHSSPHNRHSIGYFIENKNDNQHYGLFNLVILNLGETIYEKFKSNDCPNKNIVNRMKELSSKYTKKFYFLPGDFEEENLWTLYALQEGVTSISQEEYKRGNGSIRFIESFFNIKGNNEQDSISKLTLLSGKTQITFDGKYKIQEKNNSKGECNKVMTFNNSGNIEDKPDVNYVRSSKYYFPGTMINVRLLLTDDDIQLIN